MPFPDKTPATSKRFLPPSSSSSSPRPTSSSGRRGGFSFSQRNSASSSASPFTRISRFETLAKAEKDEIDASFEEGDSSPSLPTRQIFAPFGVSGKDAIDDESLNDTPLSEDETLHSVMRTPERTQYRSGSPIEDLDARVLTGTRGGVDPATPLHKRRKVSARNATIFSSSSVPDILQSSSSEGVQKLEDEHAQSNDELKHTSPEIVTPPMPTRFKTPSMKTGASKSIQSKPAFRPFAPESHLKAETHLTLPDAFTPSKRKGKIDYIPNGLADTVRNWVLDVATEESLQPSHEERVINVRYAHLDRSQRGIVVTDIEGMRWLLVSEQSRRDTGSSRESLDRVRYAGRVLLRGTLTTWTLPIGCRPGEGQVQVAAHWDVE